MPNNIFNKSEYWCGDLGYRPPGYGDFTVNTIKEMCIMLEKPQSVLDVGCAYGFSVARLNLLGILAKGIDISQYALNQAPPEFQPFFTLGAVWDMPFKDKEFDFCFSSGMLEHVPEIKLKKAISEMTRVCHRGLIGVSCLDDATTHREDDKTHEIILSQADWQALFPISFKVISDSEVGWRRHLTIQLWLFLHNHN